MCGRFSLKHTRTEIQEHFQTTLNGPLAPRYNIAPTQPVLILRENPHTSDGLETTHVVWGLIPPWAEDIRIGSKMINARCETAAEKPSFRHALRRRRCVLPASGFYEWETAASGKKQPHYFYAADGAPLALAGIWEIWDGPNGEQIESCAILTTTANATLAALHERMPVLIEPDAIPLWLDTRNEEYASIGRFMKPAPDSLLSSHAVSPAVNNVRNDSAALVERYTPPDLFG